MNEAEKLNTMEQNNATYEELDFDADHSAEYDPVSVDMVSYIRHELGLTQQQFADKYHIPLSTVSQWEQHKRMPPLYVVDMIYKLWKAELEIKDLKRRRDCVGLTVAELINNICDDMYARVDVVEDIDEDGDVCECEVDKSYGMPIHIEDVGVGISNDEKFVACMNADVADYKMVHTPWGSVLKITLAEIPAAPKKIMDEETMQQFVESINRVELDIQGGIYLKAVCVSLTSLGYDADWVDTTLWTALYDRYLRK